MHILQTVLALSAATLGAITNVFTNAHFAGLHFSPNVLFSALYSAFQQLYLGLYFVYTLSYCIIFVAYSSAFEWYQFHAARGGATQFVHETVGLQSTLVTNVSMRGFC